MFELEQEIFLSHISLSLTAPPFRPLLCRSRADIRCEKFKFPRVCFRQNCKLFVFTFVFVRCRTRHVRRKLLLARWNGLPVKVSQPKRWNFSVFIRLFSLIPETYSFIPSCGKRRRMTKGQKQRKRKMKKNGKKQNKVGKLTSHSRTQLSNRSENNKKFSIQSGRKTSGWRATISFFIFFSLRSRLRSDCCEANGTERCWKRMLRMARNNSVRRLTPDIIVTPPSI